MNYRLKGESETMDEEHEAAAFPLSKASRAICKQLSDLGWHINFYNLTNCDLIKESYKILINIDQDKLVLVDISFPDSFLTLTVNEFSLINNLINDLDKAFQERVKAHQR